MPSLNPVLCLGTVLIALATTPVLAETPPRGFTCTNIMGGNPFRLTIFEDGLYVVAPFAGTRIPAVMAEGRLELAENPIYYTVLSGALLDELKIDTIHIMSPTRLAPSGDNGLLNCEKAK